MKRILSVALLIAGAALLAGCPKKHNVIEPPNAGSQVSGSTQGEGASTSSSALAGDAGTQGGSGMGADAPFARKVIYFDFDKSEIKPEFAAVVAAMLQGVTESQLNTVSFGAERPAAEGDDETAWAKNRRVEVVYGP